VSGGDVVFDVCTNDFGADIPKNIFTATSLSLLRTEQVRVSLLNIRVIRADR
jgi:hypothetical protein